jgi:methylated-DNA-[protein]-cysteine S-methyltransferase
MSARRQPQTCSTSIDSPIGTLRLTAIDGRLSGLYMEDQRHAPAPIDPSCEREAIFAEVTAQLHAYFAGTLKEFDVPLLMRGTDFQRRVWVSLREIPYGQTTSYGEIARTVGSPSAFRAVGLANGRNPISIIVPCHRVIGAGGALTGYGGGLDRKRWLLEHETAARSGQLRLQTLAG